MCGRHTVSHGAAAVRLLQVVSCREVHTSRMQVACVPWCMRGTLSAMYSRSAHIVHAGGLRALVYEGHDVSHVQPQRGRRGGSPLRPHAGPQRLQSTGVIQGALAGSDSGTRGSVPAVTGVNQGALAGCDSGTRGSGCKSLRFRVILISIRGWGPAEAGVLHSSRVCLLWVCVPMVRQRGGHGHAQVPPVCSSLITALHEADC